MDDGILAATLRAFDGRDWDDVTPDAVAAEAGVRPAGVREMWPTTDHLAVAAVRGVIERLLAIPIARDAPLWERLEVRAGALVGALERHVYFAISLIERVQRGSAARTLLAGVALRVSTSLGRELAAARDRGEISLDVRIEAATAEVITLYTRIAVAWGGDDSDDSLETLRRARRWIAELLSRWGGAIPEPSAG